LSAASACAIRVGDGLRLTRAGRALDHEVVPARRGGDGAQLARVGVDDLERPLGRVLGVEVHPPDVVGQPDDGAPRLPLTRHELPHEPVRGERAGVGFQVLVHHELLEAEQREDGVGLDGPPRPRADRGRRLGEELLQVVAVAERVALGQVGQPHAERAAEVLGERRVDERVVLGGPQLVARARRLPRQLDRDEHERRAEHLLGVVGLDVGEHAEREEERVDALLVEREPRLLVEAPQRLVERLGRERGLEPLVGVPLAEGGGVVRGEVEGQELGLVLLGVGCGRHLVGGGRRTRAPTRHRVRLADACGPGIPTRIVTGRRRGRGRRRRRVARGTGVPGRGRRLTLGRRLEAHRLLAHHEQPEDLGGLLIDHRDRRDLGGSEVEGAVPLREIEELALPVSADAVTRASAGRDAPARGGRGSGGTAALAGTADGSAGDGRRDAIGSRQRSYAAAPGADRPRHAGRADSLRRRETVRQGVVRHNRTAAYHVRGAPSAPAHALGDSRGRFAGPWRRPPAMVVCASRAGDRPAVVRHNGRDAAGTRSSRTRRFAPLRAPSAAPGRGHGGRRNARRRTPAFRQAAARPHRGRRCSPARHTRPGPFPRVRSLPSSRPWHA
jgi:hypothetical protein